MSALLRYVLLGVVVLSGLTASGSVFLWWRGGMWVNGEMPTHGMIACTGLAFASWLFIKSYLELQNTNVSYAKSLVWSISGIVLLLCFAVIFLAYKP